MSGSQTLEGELFTFLGFGFCVVEIVPILWFFSLEVRKYLTWFLFV